MQKKLAAKAPARVTRSAENRAVRRAVAGTRVTTREEAFNQVLQKLEQFFDAAYVTVTWVDKGETFSLDGSTGNKYAVTALVQSAAEKAGPDGMDEVDTDDDQQPA